MEFNENNNLQIINNEETSLQAVSSDLVKNTENLVEDILREEDPKKIKDLTHLFNITQTKKQVLRTLSYNNLLDKVENQMEERLTKRADQFSNKDLLDYMDKISNAMDKAQKQIKDVDTTPAIQINQQNIIMGDEPELSRESRQNILNAINSIFKNAENFQQECIIVEEESVCDNDSIELSTQEEFEDSYLSEDDIINIDKNKINLKEEI